MNEKDFSQKAFEDALKATIGVMEKPTSEEEYQSFRRLIVENSDAIMDAARIKVEMEDKVNIGHLAASIVINGQKDAFAALMGTLMILCFHMGYNAKEEEAK